jgi:hypothetical protein
MNIRTTFCIIILGLLLPPMVIGRICRQHCSCKILNSKINDGQNRLKETNRYNDELLRKNIHLGNDFALRVSNNRNTIGYIHNEYSPYMSIPLNSEIHIIPKEISSSNSVRVFYDINNKGLFTDLSIPGNYTSSQISLPPRSISSINIPNGFQVIMYAEDNFQGEHIVLTSSNDNLKKFNDRTVSIEIIDAFTKKPEHVAVAYSNIDYNGKQQGLSLGNNTLISSQLKSIMIDPNHEVLIYSDGILIEIVRPIESIFSCSRHIKINIANKLLDVVVQEISEETNKYIVFYEDIDFKGSRFIVKANTTSAIEYADGKLSSIRIHPEYEVVLYDQTNFQGSYIIVNGDINNLHYYAFNDRAMSIMVRPKNSKKSFENVVLYSKPYYNGESMIVPIGHSLCSSSKLLNFCDDVYVGSIKVPEGFKVTINKNSIPLIINERVFTYTQDTSNIKNYFDTLITSIIVEKN